MTHKLLVKERKQNRLTGFDYASDRCYFVTSCTQDRIHYFGEVVGGIMYCNELGRIVQQQWEWLQNQYPYVVSHGFIVMPNHIHAILEIDSIRCQTRKIKPLSDLMGAFKTTSSKQIHLSGYPEFRWQRSYHDHIIRNDQGYWNIVNYIKNNPSNWKNDRFY